MTFAIGRRFVIADGVERWKDADVERRSPPRMAGSTRETLTSPSSPARRAARRRPPALHKAVEAAGGADRRARARSSRASCRWVQAQARGARPRARHAGRAGARRPGRRAPAAAAARAREARARARAGRRASASRRSTTSCADLGRAQGVDAGRRARRRRRAGARRARCSSCATRASGCRACCTRWSAACATRSRSPRRSPPASRRRRSSSGLRMPPLAADRLIADVAQARRRGFRRALELLADLELESRGGGRRRRLSEDTAARAARCSRLRGRRGAVTARAREAASAGGGAGGAARAARDFLRAPVLRCSAPRLTALSISWTSRRCSASARVVVAGLDRGLEAAEVGLDRRRVVAVLEALALGAQVALLLGVRCWP